MTEIRRGLTWSKKWHIIDETQGNDRYDVALCGAYLYNDAKEKAAWRGASMPNHLQKIIDGTAKSAGECKLCNRSVGRKTVTVELPEINPDKDGLHPQRWTVPLFNPLIGDEGAIDEREYSLGEVWIGRSAGKEGKIVVTSIPSILQTSGDARRFAAALLAAADWKDAQK